MSTGKSEDFRRIKGWARREQNEDKNTNSSCEGIGDLVASGVESTERGRNGERAFLRCFIV